MTHRITAARSKIARRRILIAVLAAGLIRKTPIDLNDADDIAAVVMKMMPKTLVRRLAKANDKIALDHVLARVTTIMA